MRTRTDADAAPVAEHEQGCVSLDRWSAQHDPTKQSMRKAVVHQFPTGHYPVDSLLGNLEQARKLGVDLSQTLLLGAQKHPSSSYCIVRFGRLPVNSACYKPGGQTVIRGLSEVDHLLMNFTIRTNLSFNRTAKYFYINWSTIALISSNSCKILTFLPKDRALIAAIGDPTEIFFSVNDLKM